MNSPNIAPYKMNPLYYLNDQYNDEILQAQLIKNANKTWSRSLDEQDITQGIDTVVGHASDFAINSKRNSDYNLPANTYTYKYKASSVPFYNVKAYADKYQYNKPVSLLQIMSDKSIFKNRLMFAIGEYVFLNLKIIFTEFGESILCIYPDASTGIMPSKMTSLIAQNVTWCMYSKIQSDFYYVNGTTIASLFGSTGTSVSISKFTNYNVFNKPNTPSKYDMLITADPLNPNLLYQTEAAYNGNSFTINSAFKTVIGSNTNTINCAVINDYGRVGEFQTTVSTENSSVNACLYGTYNPIHPTNIIIHKYDNTNMIKKERYSNSDVVTIESFYPDVFKFTFKRTGTYLIEYYETMVATTQFDNNFNLFKGFITNKYNLNTYANVVAARTLPEVLLNYLPDSNYVYDYSDYAASAQKGDVRAYNLYKLYELISNNMVEYRDYIKKINDKNRKYITYIESMSSANSIYNRVVRDTSNNSNDPSDIVKFNEDMIYFTYSNSKNTDKATVLYIDGLRVIPTLTKTLNNITSVYIPKSKVTGSSVITANILSCPKNKAESKTIGTFTPLDTSTAIQFPNADSFGKVNPTELVFYNVLTGEKIDKGKFSFSFDIDRYVTEHAVSESGDVNFGADINSYLLTVNDEYFKTSANEYVTLASDNVSVDTGSPSAAINKYVDASSIHIKVNDPALVNVEIGVTNTNIFDEAIIPNATIGAANTLSLNSLYTNIDSNADRFQVYANGRLLSSSEYTISQDPEKDDKINVVVNPQTGTDGKLSLALDYMSYPASKLFNKTVSLTDELQGLINIDSKGNGLNRPIDVRYVEAYINGVRVAPDKVHETAITDIIKIDGLTDGCNVTVFYDKTAEMYSNYDVVYTYLEAKDINRTLLFDSVGTYGTIEIKTGEIANYVYNLVGDKKEYRYIPTT